MSQEKPALVYDICSIPDGITLEKVVYVWQDYNIVVYDSKNGGNKPELRDDISDVQLIDVSTVDAKKLKQIQKLIES
jgi:hypothetical protein